MNKQQLITELRYYCSGTNVISSVLYFILNTDNDGRTVKKVEVVNDIQDRITAQFLEYTIAKFISNDDLSYMKLSEFDDRKNVAYKYDYDDLPSELDILQDILDEPVNSYFNFNSDDLTKLDGYLMVIGDEQKKLSIYRKHHPIDLVKRERRIYLIKDSQRFVPLNNDGFILDKGYDFMQINGDFVVLKPKTLENYFGFEKVINAESEKALVAIETSNFVENMDELKEYAEGNKPFKRKLMKIKNSPVLNISFSDVKEFVDDHPTLGVKLKYNDRSTSFNLSTISAKKEFVELLNDNYLKSTLTNIRYNSRAKDQIEPDNS